MLLKARLCQWNCAVLKTYNSDFFNKCLNKIVFVFVVNTSCYINHLVYFYTSWSLILGTIFVTLTVSGRGSVRGNSKYCRSGYLYFYSFILGTGKIPKWAIRSPRHLPRQFLDPHLQTHLVWTRPYLWGGGGGVERDHISDIRSPNKIKYQVSDPPKLIKYQISHPLKNQMSDI